MAEPVIEVEVVYAAVDRQCLLTVVVPQGTTLRAAVLVSGMGREFPEVDLANCPVGIFGKQVADLVDGLTTGVLRNAINIAVMRSLFNFRKAGIPFTGEMAKAAASDKIRVGAELRISAAKPSATQRGAYTSAVALGFDAVLPTPAP